MLGCYLCRSLAIGIGGVGSFLFFFVFLVDGIGEGVVEERVEVAVEEWRRGVGVEILFCLPQV